MLSPVTYITYSTVRLLCGCAPNQSVGTGFIYSFEIGGPEGMIAAMVVTNKHVISGFDNLTLTLSTVPKDFTPTDDGRYDDVRLHEVTITGFQDRTIRHPDPEVDLAAFPISPIANALPKDRKILSSFVNRHYELTVDEAKALRPIEPIVMIGYPNGIWDSVNNRPLVRRGMTASHPLVEWCGKREFVIDAACFPGSSGSPVFLFEDGLFRQPNGTYTPGSRARFLGVLYAGPRISETGLLVPEPIPTATQFRPVTPMMMNLGFVIHASRVQELQPLVVELSKRF